VWVGESGECVCIFGLVQVCKLLFYDLGSVYTVSYSDREDASSMVTAGATANTTEGNSRASRESGLLRSHSHGESIDSAPAWRRARC